MSGYRYERKFFITVFSKHEVENIVRLHPAIFNEIYHKRFVNNIYFDSLGFSNLRDNVDGVANRIKIRIRWYGELFGYIENPILEIKVKKGLLGKKISIPIKPFELTKDLDIFEILCTIKNHKEQIGIDFASLVPALLNRYSRKYYQSHNGHSRITIDADQSFYKINRHNNWFLNQTREKKAVILELKYEQDFDHEANYITTNFPFRITKSSKYVSGIQKISQLNFS